MIRAKHALNLPCRSIDSGPALRHCGIRVYTESGRLLLAAGLCPRWKLCLNLGVERVVCVCFEKTGARKDDYFNQMIYDWKFDVLTFPMFGKKAGVPGTVLRTVQCRCYFVFG